MVTVFEVSRQYAESKNIAPFSNHDLRKIGGLASGAFRRGWGIENIDLARTARFDLATELGRKIIIIYYPDEFKSEINKCISAFILEKEERRIANLPKPKPEKPVTEKRKRIVPGKKPVFSTRKPISPFKITPNV